MPATHPFRPPSQLASLRTPGAITAVTLVPLPPHAEQRVRVGAVDPSMVVPNSTRRDRPLTVLAFLPIIRPACRLAGSKNGHDA